MKVSLTTILLFFILSLSAQISPGINNQPLRAKIKKGTLENGLTFYICDNPNSKGKVNLYFLQNAGAVLEGDHQNGLAHFTEHMCFKGTKNFPNRAIFDYFESMNMMDHMNAVTSDETTKYWFENIPSTNEEMIDQCLLMIHDWCHYVTFDTTDINSERPIVIEEIHFRNNGPKRLQNQIVPYTYNHSIYSKRNVAGDVNIISNFDHKDLTSFYDDWYRTDLQAVVVVGDVDVKMMKNKIQRLFKNIPKSDFKAKPDLTIEDNSKDYFMSLYDEDNKSGQISIKYRIDHDNSFEGQVMNQLINYLFSVRCALLPRKSKALTAANINYFQQYRRYGEYDLSILHRPNQAEEALKVLISMHKDVLTNGFTQEELKNGIASLLYQNQMAKNNSWYFDCITKNFTENCELYDDIKYKLKFEGVLKKISSEDIRKQLNTYVSSKNKSTIVFENGIDSMYLSQDRIALIEKNTLAKCYDLAPVSSFKKNKEYKLITKKPNVGAIKTKKNVGNNVINYELSNGAEVVYKYDPQEFSIFAVSYGGSSLYDEDEFVNAKFCKEFKPCLTIGNFSYNEMREYCRRSNILFDYKINEIYENVSIRTKANNNSEQVNIYFEMIHGLFESSYLDQAKFDSILVHKKEQAAYKKTYQDILSDSLNYYRYGNRYVSLNKKNIASLSHNSMQKIYSQRFSNGNDWTFFVSGNLKEEDLEKAICKYIASINTKGDQEPIRYFMKNFKTGHESHDLDLKMPANRSGNAHLLVKTIDSDKTHESTMKLVRGVIKKDLVKILREKLGGTYQIDIGGKIQKGANNKCNAWLEINYECDQSQLKALNRAFKYYIDRLAARGITRKQFEMETQGIKGQLNYEIVNDFIKNYFARIYHIDVFYK